MRLLFQPAEEGGAGASHMIEEGALGDSEAIFGMHVDYETMTGSIASTFGPLLAAVCFFEAKIEGKSRAHSNVDPILAASSAILALQQLISREADPLDSQVCPFFLFYLRKTVKRSPMMIKTHSLKLACIFVIHCFPSKGILFLFSF